MLVPPDIKKRFLEGGQVDLERMNQTVISHQAAQNQTPMLNTTVSGLHSAYAGQWDFPLFTCTTCKQPSMFDECPSCGLSHGQKYDYPAANAAYDNCNPVGHHSCMCRVQPENSNFQTAARSDE